ncbi:class I SAM-dependent methyltransferase [Candidatus Woesearchaeota archaeon]|nr:class I SAM-dependent methyltransferase [Candidatus Woesearchaeota archaeon]
MGIYDFKLDKYSSHMKIISFLNKMDLGKELNILDVGCSKGFIARSLQNSKYRFYGIEIDKDDIMSAKKYYKEIRSINLDNEKPAYKEGFFDIIILADIIEHLKDPDSIIRHFKKFLKKDGIMIISVPNVANAYVRLKLLFGMFEYEEKGIMDKTHLRFFTLNSIKRLCKESGLRAISLEFTPIPLPLVNKIFESGKPFHFLHVLNYYMMRALPKLLCFQVILFCKK